MSYWERLLCSSQPETASWPPGFVKATIPRSSPRLNKKRVITSNAGHLQPVAVPAKRRPSVLGGGFSTVSSTDNNLLAPDFGCGEHLGGGSRRPETRGTVQRSGGRSGDENDSHEDDRTATAAEVSVVGQGDRHRRRSSQYGRPRELSNRNIVVLGDTSANSQQIQEATSEHPEGGAGSGRRGSEPGTANPASIPAAYVDIVSRETTGSEADSASISIEYAPDVFTTKCPDIKPPPFASKEVDHTESASSTGFAASSTSPRSGDGRQTSPTCSPPTPALDGGVSTMTAATATRWDGVASAPSLSALSGFGQHNRSDDAFSGFPELQRETLGWGRRGSTAKESWNACAAGPAATAAVAFRGGGSQKVFHNFVFRRNKRRNKDPTSSSSSSSSPPPSSSLRQSLEECGSFADDAPGLSSRDGTTADRSTSAARTASSGGRGRCGGSLGSSVTARTSAWRHQRSWEAPFLNEWDRPERAGQVKRTRPPPRTANDAFSVSSFVSRNQEKTERGDGGGGGGGGWSGCCSGGPGSRPVKCQRCGSFRVHLFASSVSTRSLQGFLRQTPPAGGGRPAAHVGGDGSANSSRNSGSARQRSSAPTSRHRVFKNGAISRLSTPPPPPPPDHGKLTGWSDAGRPVPTAPTWRGVKPSPGNGGVGGGGGTFVGGRGGGIEADPRGRTGAAADTHRKASVRPPPLAR